MRLFYRRIFEPFYTKKVLGRSGTGLGLAVVWNVVQDHKGYIGVKSNKNGTTFELFFPITREEISGKELSMPFKDLKGDGEKILVDSRATGGNFCGVSEPDMASSPIQGINGKLIAKR